ncbi:hypothetical protein [Sodalis praecaptivus]|uniref:hypothetical protein n=1 Tax=Sodalis praecaptivus TaxID=1239307 RepID=UPI00280AE431|nr:hypothetical protein [Sodalis praecaptivus]
MPIGIALAFGVANQHRALGFWRYLSVLRWFPALPIALAFAATGLPIGMAI